MSLRLATLTLAVAGAVSGFVASSQITLFFHSNGYPLTVCKQLLPIEFSGRNHGEITLNLSSYLTRGIPELAERKPMSFRDPFKPVVNAAHSTLDLL